MGVSRDGSTVVGEAYTVGPGSKPKALLWDGEKGMRTVEAELWSRGVALPSDWHLRLAKAISADGHAINGVGTNLVRRLEAWLVIIPEPGRP